MIRTPLALVLLTFASGCSAPLSGSTELTVSADSYAYTFNRAKRVLRESGFELDRVDARAGVLMSFPAPSAGATTPWRGHHLTAREAILGLIHHEQRIAVVTFEPFDGTSVDDVRLYAGDLRVVTDVLVERVEQGGNGGRRDDASSIFFTSTSLGSNEKSKDLHEQIAVARRNDA